MRGGPHLARQGDLSKGQAILRHRRIQQCRNQRRRHRQIGRRIHDPQPARHVQIHLARTEPQPGPLWKNDPTMRGDIRALLESYGAEILPFESRHFGQAYPYGNKIECLMALPEGELEAAIEDRDGAALGVALAAYDQWLRRPEADLEELLRSGCDLLIAAADAPAERVEPGP